MSDRIPAYALYVDPPLGRVGLSETEAVAYRPWLLVSKRPMTRVGRAIEKGETKGFMKVVADAETKQILGAAILGVGGDEAIHGILDMMNAGATTDGASTAKASQKYMSVRMSYRKTARSFTRRGSPCARRYSQDTSSFAATPMACAMAWMALFTLTLRAGELYCCVLSSRAMVAQLGRRDDVLQPARRPRHGVLLSSTKFMRGVRRSHSAPRQWRYAQLRRDKDHINVQNPEG